VIMMCDIMGNMTLSLMTHTTQTDLNGLAPESPVESMAARRSTI